MKKHEADWEFRGSVSIARRRFRGMLRYLKWEVRIFEAPRAEIASLSLPEKREPRNGVFMYAGMPVMDRFPLVE